MTTRIETELGDPRLPQRFWAKVERAGTCWTWTALRGYDGYGRYRLDGRNPVAHRVAYEALVGAVSEGLDLDHLCRVRSCVNPEHLEPVTRLENVMRGEGLAALNARKTHCKNGHEFDAVNTYRAGGHRRCRACRRAYQNQWNAERRTVR